MKYRAGFIFSRPIVSELKQNKKEDPEGASAKRDAAVLTDRNN